MRKTQVWSQPLRLTRWEVCQRSTCSFLCESSFWRPAALSQYKWEHRSLLSTPFRATRKHSHRPENTTLALDACPAPSRFWFGFLLLTRYLETGSTYQCLCPWRIGAGLVRLGGLEQVQDLPSCPKLECLQLGSLAWAGPALPWQLEQVYCLFLKSHFHSPLLCSCGTSPHPWCGQECLGSKNTGDGIWYSKPSSNILGTWRWVSWTFSLLPSSPCPFERKLIFLKSIYRHIKVLYHAVLTGYHFYCGL